MIVLGIDPGIERVGWGLVEYQGSTVSYRSCGCIKTSKDLPHPDRIALIVKEIQSIIKKENPGRAVIEKLFFGKNKKTAIAVSESRGAILWTLRNLNIEIREYTPLEVKMSLTGNGRAEKRQVAWVVKNILHIKEEISSDDALDALALCLMVAK